MSEDQDNLRRFPIPIALLLSLWSGAIAAFNAYFWFCNTWRIFVHLRWYSFALLINPSAYFWFFLVSSCWYAPLNFTLLPWGRYDHDFNRTKVALMVIFVPVIVTVLFSFPGGWYPIKPAEGGGAYLRFLPFL